MMTGEGLDVLAEANVMDKEDAKVLKKAGEFVDENKDQIAGLLEESPSATEKDGDGPKEQSFQPKVKQSHDQKVSSHKQVCTYSLIRSVHVCSCVSLKTFIVYDCA